MIYKENVSILWEQVLKIFVDGVHDQNYLKTTPLYSTTTVGPVSTEWPELRRSLNSEKEVEWGHREVRGN